MNKNLPFLLLSTVSLAFAEESCRPSFSTTCSMERCDSCHCIGPDNVHSNSQVRPYTCNGDVRLGASALYWKANITGLEFAVLNQTGFSIESSEVARGTNTLIDATYQAPSFTWDTGFRFLVGYNSPCDGWDLCLSWTNFASSNAQDYNASTHFSPFGLFPENISADSILVAFSSAFQGAKTGSEPNLRTRMSSNLALKLDVFDLTLGREFWVSKYLAIRPFLGIAHNDISLMFQQTQYGASLTIGNINFPYQPDLIDHIENTNKFSGTGVKAGFEATFNFGCGWAIFGGCTPSILYGSFWTRNKEYVRAVESPFTKTPILETKNRIQASRANIELALGIQYFTYFFQESYTLMARLGWESNIFFHQNQLFRVTREDYSIFLSPFPNNNGENVFIQSRGTLSTQGLTFSFEFGF